MMFRLQKQITPFLGFLGLVLALCSPAMAEKSLEGSRPNIVIIMPDDISYGSIHAYGGKDITPSLDAMYEKSVRFEDFHVSPTCAPTRAALMIGRHECYGGVTHTVLMRERLSLETRTMANMLKDAGYSTGIFGKWHLGDEEAYRPDRRSFDEVYIHGGGGISQNYAHSSDFPNNDYNNPVLYHNGKAIETRGYCTDLFFQQAITWIGQQQRKGNRFFCYIPTNVNHNPHIPPILPDGTTGNIIANLDENIGRMMKFLEESGLDEQTLLIFFTDNGSDSGVKKLRGGKGSPYEGGTRVPCMMYWKGHIEGGIDCSALIGHIDLYPTFAKLVGSDAPVPGNRPWDGRSVLPLLENPQANMKSRYWVTHKTRWRNLGRAKYAGCAIRDQRYKIVLGRRGKAELYDLSNDVRETTNIASEHPEVVQRLKDVYDQWWDDIQPCLINDRLTDIPETLKPYHEIYLRDFGQERYDEAMRLMQWNRIRPWPPKSKEESDN